MSKAAEVIRKYIAFREAELQFKIDNRSPSPIGGGDVMKLQREIDNATGVLHEMERFAEWVEAGEGDYAPPLNEDEKRFYREAIKRGLDVTTEIREQL